jgi:SAM-dependent methyltransferase
MNINALNAAMKKYPMSFSDENGDSIEDKGWAYGVWYCGTSFTKVKLYGQYPPTFMKRALALFPDAKDILHAPSGQLQDLPAGHVTMDMYSDDVRKPMFQGNVDNMPFADESFDLILSDPPYSEEDSRLYGCAKFPEKKFMAECRRVLRPDGYMGFLAYHYPSYRRQDWQLKGLFAVVTGFSRRTRMFSVFQKTKSEPYEYRGEDNG